MSILKYHQCTVTQKTKKTNSHLKITIKVNKTFIKCHNEALRL